MASDRLKCSKPGILQLFPAISRLSMQRQEPLIKPVHTSKTKRSYYQQLPSHAVQLAFFEVPLQDSSEVEVASAPKTSGFQCLQPPTKTSRASSRNLQRGVTMSHLCQLADLGKLSRVSCIKTRSHALHTKTMQGGRPACQCDRL